MSLHLVIQSSLKDLDCQMIRSTSNHIGSTALNNMMQPGSSVPQFFDRTTVSKRGVGVQLSSSSESEEKGCLEDEIAGFLDNMLSTVKESRCTSVDDNDSSHSGSQSNDSSFSSDSLDESYSMDDPGQDQETLKEMDAQRGRAINALTVDHDPQLLMDLFDSKVLLGLRSWRLENFFYSVMDSGQESLIRKLLGLNLTDLQRATILKFAGRTSNLELIKAVVEGAEGQNGCDMRSVLERKSHIWIEQLIQNNVDKDIIEYVCSVLNFSQADLQDLELRKCLANVWEIDKGHFILNGEVVEYGGMYVHFLIDNLLSCLEEFDRQMPHQLHAELMTELSEAIDTSRRSTPTSEKLRRYQAGKAIMIHTGYREHHVDVVLCGKFAMLCNRGDPSGVELLAYNMNPELVTIGLIDEIIEQGDVEDSQKCKAYFMTLTSRFSGEDLPLMQLFIDHWKDIPAGESTADCVVINTQAAMTAVAGVSMWQKSPQKSEAIEAILCEVENFHNALPFLLLRRYIAYGIQHPHRYDRKLIDMIFSQMESKNVTKKAIEELRQYCSQV